MLRPVLERYLHVLLFVIAMTVSGGIAVSVAGSLAEAWELSRNAEMFLTLGIFTLVFLGVGAAYLQLRKWWFLR